MWYYKDMENSQTTMETTTLLIWTRSFFDEVADVETDGKTASIEVYKNSNGSLSQTAIAYDKDLKIEEFGLNEGRWTERMERHSIDLPIHPEEFDHNLLEFYSPFTEASYDGKETEVEDGNGTCWGATYEVKADGAMIEIDD
jgi:hypothetical protein